MKFLKSFNISVLFIVCFLLFGFGPIFAKQSAEYNDNSSAHISVDKMLGNLSNSINKAAQLILPNNYPSPKYWGKTEYDFTDVAKIVDNKIVMVITTIDRNLGQKVKTVIAEAEAKYIKHIVLKIQSFGGSSIDSLDALILLQYWTEKKENVLETRIEPHAISAGFFLAISGDKGHRYGTPASMLMWHEGSIMAMFQGRLTATDANELANLFNTLGGILNRWIAEKSDMTKREVDLAVYKGAWWMDAYEAKDHGFIDHVVEWGDGNAETKENPVE